MDTLENSMIHPTAIIEEGAQLDPSVSIGPYAYIGPNVRLGKDCKIHHHATVEGNTTLGEGNEVFPYALIGGKTHDKKFEGGTPGLIIGNFNTFREFTTVHEATNDGDFTRVGDHNLFLAYVHIGHDCILGSHITMSCHATLAGHVEIEDYANISGLTGILQFCKVGAYAMVGAFAKINQDVPPFMLVDGSPPKVRTYNKVGLERNHLPECEIEAIKACYNTLYRSGLNRTQAFKELEQSGYADSKHLAHLKAFAEKSQQGWI